MDVLTLAALGGAGCALIVAVILGVKLRGRGTQLADLRAQLAEAKTQLQRYAPIIDVEAHAAALQGELAKATAERDAFLASDQKRRAELNAQYQEALALFQRLKGEVTSLEENLEDMSFGLYKPHYSLESSESYRKALEHVYEMKKEKIRDGTAAACTIEWTVNNSKAEGARMTKKNIKVMLRAFNGEVDAAVAKVTWNNITRMEERIRKAFEAINEMGSSNLIAISKEYLGLALAELRLTYEYERKKQEEKEEQRRIREQMREEDKALREAERAEQEAAAEETRFEKALAKARAEVEKAKGEELQAANAKLADLENRLAEAHAKMERAKSLAQLTRSGHVYVVSNIGSFGEQTFKIGMTRRLDPDDRVKELSDASVPFDFDVHAMIHSEDAPGLEAAFHREFAERRVNLVDMRKEFFAVTLAEIEGVARRLNLPVEFTKVAEAREYRETRAIRQQAAMAAASSTTAPPEESVVELFPKQLLVS
jgi:multidrug efflux pump subunit AcrA (membrane-fusion protein)